MNEGGIFVSGLFIGCEERNQVKNDVNVRTFHYLVACGSDAYKIKSDNDYRGRLSFGDQVDFKVRLNAFNGNVYISGELWEDVENV